MSKLGKEGHNGHFRICLMRIMPKMNSVVSLKGQWLEQKRGSSSSWFFFEFFLERERLLSSFPADPTVGSLRDKKESCST